MTVVSKHRDDAVVIFERYDSPYFSCRIRLNDNKWETRSTKCKKHEDAVKFAKKWHDEVQVLQERGLAVKRRTFASICDTYLAELDEEIELGFKNPRNKKDYEAVINRYLRPYFGTRYIDLISNRDIAEYQKWRAAYWISGEGSKQKFITYKRGSKKIKRPAPKGRPQSRTGQNRENVVLRAIFQTAIKHDLLKEAQVPAISIARKSNEESNRRPAFNKEEYDELLQFLFSWHKEPKIKNKERRWLLRNYVLFLAHSGLRPGTETDNLCWKHIREIKNKKGQTVSVLSINGKTGKRDPVATGQAHTALVQIKADMIAAKTDIEPDLAVFSLPDGTPVKNDYFRQLFRKALIKTDLLTDNTGAQRSLYSLRHTYATFQLLYNKINIYTLKEQMGTSIKMIEDHYGHLTPELAVDEITDKSVDDVISAEV